VAAQSKAWVWGRSLAGIAGSNPVGAWMSVSCECCVLSGRGLSVGLISCTEEFYRVWCVWVWSRSPVKGDHDPGSGRSATGGGGRDFRSGWMNSRGLLVSTYGRWRITSLYRYRHWALPRAVQILSTSWLPTSLGCILTTYYSDNTQFCNCQIVERSVDSSLYIYNCLY